MIGNRTSVLYLFEPIRSLAVAAPCSSGTGSGVPRRLKPTLQAEARATIGLYGQVILWKLFERPFSNSFELVGELYRESACSHTRASLVCSLCCLWGLVNVGIPAIDCRGRRVRRLIREE